MGNGDFINPDTLEVLYSSIVRATGIPEKYFLDYIPYKKKKMRDYLEKLKILLEE